MRSPFVALGIAVALLAALDVVVRAWNPLPVRLPENVSAAYVERMLTAYAGKPHTVLVVGDSGIWGYKVPAEESLVADLARALPNATVLNLSVEGGSPANSYVAIRGALARGVRPALVVMNLNLKEFSPTDRSYQRIMPAFEPIALGFASADRAGMEFNPKHETALASQVERFWAFYRYRTDLRQALFGDADFASWLATRAKVLSGRAAREAIADEPTADRYLGTYDLEPIDPANVSLGYLRRALALLAARRIPVLAFLTPTNHGLLHDTIDAPEYGANLRFLAAQVRAGGGTVVDEDRAFGQADFIDNDHLKPPALRRLAARLAPSIASAAR